MVILMKKEEKLQLVQNEFEKMFKSKIGDKTKELSIENKTLHFEPSDTFVHECGSKRAAELELKREIKPLLNKFIMMVSLKLPSMDRQKLEKEMEEL